MVHLKKSQASTLNSLIILVVVALLAFAGFMAWKAISDKSTDFEKCRNSVLAQTIIKKAPDVLSSNIKYASDCKTYDLKFYNDHVEKAVVKDGKQQTQDYAIKLPGKKATTKFNGLNNEIVNTVIAQEMSTCWSQFLEGKQHIFLDNSFLGNDWNDNNNLCFVCNTIQFDVESVKQEQFTGFYDFLKYAQKPSSTGQYTGLTYYNYIMNSSPLCYYYYKPFIDTTWHYTGPCVLNPTSSWALKDMIQEINKRYNTNLNPDASYDLATIQSQFPSDYCWNSFIDGLPQTWLGACDATYGHKATVTKDIVFERDKTYDIVLVRMGEDKSDDTYFIYVVNSSSLNNLCNQIAI